MAIYDTVISGVFNNNPNDVSCGSIVGDTLNMREEFENLPEELWVIEKHEDGAFCFNTKIVDNNGEFAIINYEYGIKNSTDPIATTFNDFYIEWFLKTWSENNKKTNTNHELQRNFFASLEIPNLGR